ncbi:MAG: ROK family transcriptional regulator [Chloroflexi bacterium]|nr:ROK family transcriptional regulator [Chloroflexota bacterium]MCA2001997.1 ROK family transcriptional regulator [Chloroflexota bacterium]
MITGDQEKVRKINRSLILNTLRLHAPISRAQVANLTGLTRGTVSNIVNTLLEDGLVFEDTLEDSKIGRPSILLRLRPDGGAVVGVEIGVNFISVLLTNFVAEALWETRVETSLSQSQTEIISEAEKLIDQALAVAKKNNLRPLGIGVGLPGLVNVRQGNLIVAPNLRWKNLPLRLIWNQRFHLPIYIDNEANLAALGEYYFGAARNVENFVALTSDIGLGGGIMIDGRLFRGGHGYGGEIGHIQRDPQGEQCGCGRIGCWETQVGPRAVLQRVKKEFQIHPDQSLLDACLGDLNNLTFEIVVQFASNGNLICRKAIEEVAFNLGVGIADLVNIFNPDLVVIGGAFILAKDIMQSIIEDAIFSNALQPATETLRIGFSERRTGACVLGAVAVVLDDILREMVIS